ncbi:restriction endonuclease [Nevskia ramosa]|uniref:restriction endonuclease n=1 Tax=Nevskia ramosa TaxID=64002 RepID=UPI000412B2A3|nr:restriction endonuclease [Nevskia ramosa]
MPRRKGKSAFDDWVEILSRLPWQACLILAFVSWLGFHQLAQIELPKPTTVSGLGAAYGPMMARTLGMFMQLMAPAACVFAALISWVGKRRRTKLLADAEARTTVAPLAQLTWKEFEQLVGAHFERLGYSVRFTPDGADGGVDVVASKGSETYLIQCKQWRATQVGVSVVRELFGLIAARGATGGYVVSIGPFTPDAHAFAAGRNIELVDANQLLRSKQAAVPTSPTAAAPALKPAEASNTTSPICPKCGSQMTRRIAKQGANAGQAFYGCSTYPKCRAVLPAS